MFCPECKSEFIDGIEKCPECKLKLVEELPPGPKPPKSEYVEFEEIPVTLCSSDIMILKLVLD